MSWFIIYHIVGLTDCIFIVISVLKMLTHLTNLVSFGSLLVISLYLPRYSMTPSQSARVGGDRMKAPFCDAQYDLA